MSKIGSNILSKSPKYVLKAYQKAAELKLSEEEIDLIRRFNLNLKVYNARNAYSSKVIDSLVDKEILYKKEIERGTRGYKTTTITYYRFTNLGKKLRQGLKYREISYKKPTIVSKDEHVHHYGGQVYVTFNRDGSTNIQSHKKILGNYDNFKIKNAVAVIHKDYSNTYKVDTPSPNSWENNTSRINFRKVDKEWTENFIKDKSLKIDVEGISSCYAVDKDTLSLLRYMSKQHEILAEISKTIPPTISPQRLRKVLESASRLV